MKQKILPLLFFIFFSGCAALPFKNALVSFEDPYTRLGVTPVPATSDENDGIELRNFIPSDAVLESREENTLYAMIKNGKGKQLQFGLKNVLLGWLDLFQEPHHYAVEHKNVFSGIGKGLLDTLSNEVGGALHTVTFFIPQIDIPLPENGVDLGK